MAKASLQMYFQGVNGNLLDNELFDISGLGPAWSSYAGGSVSEDNFGEQKQLSSAGTPPETFPQFTTSLASSSAPRPGQHLKSLEPTPLPEASPLAFPPEIRLGRNFLLPSNISHIAMERKWCWNQSNPKKRSWASRESQTDLKRIDKGPNFKLPSAGVTNETDQWAAAIGAQDPLRYQDIYSEKADVEARARRRNREHARKSRQRKKDMTTQLHMSIEELRAENMRLRRQIAASLGRKKADAALNSTLSSPTEEFVKLLKPPEARILNDKTVSFLRQLSDKLCCPQKTTSIPGSSEEAVEAGSLHVVG